MKGGEEAWRSGAHGVEEEEDWKRGNGGGKGEGERIMY